MQSLSIVDRPYDYMTKLDRIVSENRDNYRNFINEIYKLLTQNGFSQEYITEFLTRSFISLMELDLHISRSARINYQVQEEGRLNNPSKQCSFTFASFNNVLYFIKLVDYDKQLKWSNQDLLLFDIITGFIFKRIIREDDKKYISATEYSFLSYYKHNKYNYADIYNGYLRSLRLFKDEDMICCYVSMTKAINGSTIYDIFYIKDEKYTCKSVLEKYCEFVDFLIKIGFYYGFTHNDLHFNNLMFNGENIVLLDFGSALFYKYYETDDAAINLFLKDEIIKMKYDEDFVKISNLRKQDIQVPDISIKTYKELFERKYALFKLDECYIPSGIQQGSDLKYEFSVYPHILFDLITFYFNMYVIYILYLKSYYEDEFRSFYSYFSQLILIYTTENKPKPEYIYDIDIRFIKDEDKSYKYYSISESERSENEKIDEIFRIYEKIYDEYIISITPREKQRQYKYLLDGLLLIVLLLIISVKRPRTNKFFRHPAPINLLKQGFQVFLKIEDKVKFFQILKGILERKRSIILKTEHHFFIKMLDSEDDVSGGYIIKQKKIKRLKKYSMKGGADASTSTVAIISDIYEKERRIPIIDNYISMYRNKEKQDLRNNLNYDLIDDR